MQQIYSQHFKKSPSSRGSNKAFKKTDMEIWPKNLSQSLVLDERMLQEKGILSDRISSVPLDKDKQFNLKLHLNSSQSEKRETGTKGLRVED